MGHKNDSCMKLNIKECCLAWQVEQCNYLYLMRRSTNSWVRVNGETLVFIN